MHIDIIFGILLTLNRKGNITAKELANKYEISIRTVYRYLSILDSNNVPITTKRGKNGGIFLNNNVKLNNLFFTAAEKTALLNMTHTIQSPSIRQSVQTKLLNMWQKLSQKQYFKLSIIIMYIVYLFIVKNKK